MKNIILVDDHPVVLATVKGIVEKEGYKIVDQFSDGQAVLKKLRNIDYKVDAIILDISLPGMDGLELTQKIKNYLPEAKILIFTSQNSIYFARRCMEAGANGFVSKSQDVKEIGLALNTVLRGYNFFPDGALSTLSNKKMGDDPLSMLSKREFLVMKFLINGSNNNEIARELSLSEKTISTYKKRIFDKLGVNHVLELADFAKRNDVS
ncbi:MULTISPECIES: response regulator transcription factor [Vibrio]|uniref:response regulator transcription factor n=1 Tax=Vibrio TaxID=662 RepID=UPI0014824277|nr:MULTISPECIES: response regulator transcription factor [Vibrio]MDQ2164972.1 response regulator transcription factor [Vibrio anguillarum]MDQ2193651.1 response regulator transcription factor [Vibrio sp. A14(2019)]MDQ2198016.1 response regulator transcription factor [Vibrio sp. 2017_1457_11]NNN77101.1 response regulator transcription factor [Vibrio sp. B7]NNN93915.1 response regulator transcription factor [Vibrio sp. B8-1]